MIKVAALEGNKEDQVCPSRALSGGAYKYQAA